MPNREHKNQQDSPMDLVNDSIIASPYSPRVRDGGHLLATHRKRLLTQGLNFGGQSPLDFAREFFQLSQRKRLELNRIGHNCCRSYSLRSFLIFSQGIVRGSFSAFRAAATSISSSSLSKSSTSSMGTTAATAFLPRCTITLSPRYSARLRMSEKFCRALLAVSLSSISRLLGTYCALRNILAFCTICNKHNDKAANLCNSPTSKPSARESGKKWTATPLSSAWAKTSASTAGVLKSLTVSSTPSAPSAATTRPSPSPPL